MFFSNAAVFNIKIQYVFLVHEELLCPSSALPTGASTIYVARVKT